MQNSMQKLWSRIYLYGLILLLVAVVFENFFQVNSQACIKKKKKKDIYPLCLIKDDLEWPWSVLFNWWGDEDAELKL